MSVLNPSIIIFPIVLKKAKSSRFMTFCIFKDLSKLEFVCESLYKTVIMLTMPAYGFLYVTIPEKVLLSKIAKTPWLSKGLPFNQSIPALLTFQRTDSFAT